MKTVIPSDEHENNKGDIRSAKPFPDESNREAIQEMLWDAVQWAMENEPELLAGWTDQIPDAEEE